MSEPLASPLPTCPLVSAHVRCGFPSPAEDSLDRDLNLHEHLVTHPSATFFLRARGDSMVRHCINDGDLLVVDRSLEAIPGAIVVAVVDGEFTVKQLRYRGSQPFLVAGNPAYPPLAITEDMECQVWGVVAHVVHTFAARQSRPAAAPTFSLQPPTGDAR